MPLETVWTQPAKVDLREIYWYIAGDSHVAADRVIEQIRERVKMLTTQPYIGRVVPEASDEHIRELIQGSYRIVYTFDDAAVYILRVSHHARLLKL